MDKLKVIGKEKLGSIEFTGIEGGFGKNKKAMLVKDIALIHGQTVGNINLLINRNRNRFKDGIDVIDLKSGNFALVLNNSGFSQNQINATKNIYLLSERGYSKLLKLLEDDKAWEVYDQLVDSYFNMRTAIKTSNPEIVKNKRLEIMEKNAATRRGALMYRIAMATDSNSSKQTLLADAAKELIGEMTIPVMSKREYSAGQVGDKLNISANKVGRIANKFGIKSDQPGQNEFGRWANSKSQHSDKEVPQWLYFEEGLKFIKEHVEVK
ncbi:ORF6N domain-containing protein [Companilactobacillus hulinensis]|uniref:ORF6N domain-containing protein n=1 Tax=Companilactobacillus hulinensis TaxID=2486007 RepID=UPI000F76DABF|nr:ORF6N domain-containing protein [Companilactobacillus hulinensis]